LEAYHASSTHTTQLVGGLMAYVDRKTNTINDIVQQGGKIVGKLAKHNDKIHNYDCSLVDPYGPFGASCLPPRPDYCASLQKQSFACNEW
jgi:hypothetical protein